MKNHNYHYPRWGQLLHAGLAVFGITSYLTAELAEYGTGGAGYLVHAYLGMSLFAVILLRLGSGYASAGIMRFRGWFPVNYRQISLAIEDVKFLLARKMPVRGAHEGIAGVLQATGLLIFAWMGATGTAMYFLDTSPRWLEILEELHEAGESLVPLYLLLHVGSVILHSLAGSPVWQKMWKYGK